MSEVADTPGVPEGTRLDGADAITVLHVDDDGALLDMAATFLERDNDAIDVVTETDVDAAIDRIEDGTRIDCVVSDYRMPGTDGIEFLEAVRERRPDVPFILFTGEGSEAVAERAFSAGATDYFRKEATTDQYAVLAKRIRCVVERTRNRRTVDRLTAATETAREGISMVDPDGRFRYVNRAYADVFGYDRADLLGEHWTVLYDEAGAERVREEVLPALPETGTWRGETTQQRADGTAVVTDHVLASTDDGSLVSNVREATARPKDSGVPTAALDALEDLVFVFGADGTLESWNDRVPELTGLSPEELASTTPADLVADEDAERMERYVDETRASGEARVEVRLDTADDGTVVHEFISRAIRDDEGDVVARIGLGRDVSTRKEYETRIERQNERLDRFAGIVSHDLRNPLFVAKEQFRLFRDTGDPGDYERGQRALARVESLITDVLALAQSGDAIHLEEYETVDLAAVAEDAWSLIELEDTSMTVESTLPVRADASRLRQLLENLFRNAIEHGGTGVSLRVGPLPNGAGFYVADDGPGIPQADRDVVFESGYSSKADGTGFGLATVDLLVDAHGWDVAITDGAGGARFEITGVETGSPDA